MSSSWPPSLPGTSPCGKRCVSTTKSDAPSYDRTPTSRSGCADADGEKESEVSTYFPNASRPRVRVSPAVLGCSARHGEDGEFAPSPRRSAPHSELYHCERCRRATGADASSQGLPARETRSAPVAFKRACIVSFPPYVLYGHNLNLNLLYMLSSPTVYTVCTICTVLIQYVLYSPLPI